MFFCWGGAPKGQDRCQHIRKWETTLSLRPRFWRDAASTPWRWTRVTWMWVTRRACGFRPNSSETSKRSTVPRKDTRTSTPRPAQLPSVQQSFESATGCFKMLPVFRSPSVYGISSSQPVSPSAPNTVDCCLSLGFVGTQKYVPFDQLTTLHLGFLLKKNVQGILTNLAVGIREFVRPWEPNREGGQNREFLHFE